MPVGTVVVGDAVGTAVGMSFLAMGMEVETDAIGAGVKNADSTSWRSSGASVAVTPLDHPSLPPASLSVLR